MYSSPKVLYFSKISSGYAGSWCSSQSLSCGYLLVGTSQAHDQVDTVQPKNVDQLMVDHCRSDVIHHPPSDEGLSVVGSTVQAPFVLAAVVTAVAVQVPLHLLFH